MNCIVDFLFKNSPLFELRVKRALIEIIFVILVLVFLDARCIECSPPDKRFKCLLKQCVFFLPMIISLNILYEKLDLKVKVKI